MDRTLSRAMNSSSCSHVDGAKFTVLRIIERFSRRTLRHPAPAEEIRARNHAIDPEFGFDEKCGFVENRALAAFDHRYP